MGSEQGVSEEKILALNEYAQSPLYDAKERAALEYADAITLTDRDVDDGLFARVRGFFYEDALVELTAVLFCWHTSGVITRPPRARSHPPRGRGLCKNG